jgi:hypothetical protein
VWVIEHSFSSSKKAEAVSWLARDRSEDPRLGKIAGRLRVIPGSATEKILLAILEKNPDRVARGKACYSLASLYKSNSDLARALKRPGRSQEAARTANLSEEELRQLAKSDPDQFGRLAEQYCERTIAKYRDIN